MAFLVLCSILLTRNLRVDHISKRQAVLETIYNFGSNFFEGLLGKEGRGYVPYLMPMICCTSAARNSRNMLFLLSMQGV